LDSEENKKVVEGWLEPLGPSERQDFLDNMAEVITAAEKQRVDIVAAINRYKELKLAKIAEAKQGSDFIGITIRPLNVVIGIFFQLALIALISLVLVLLAIERNTRRPENVA
jgi:wobble nucleotide-excising tRNase